MIEAVLAVTLGVTAGILTGLMPGIHPNTVVFTIIPFYFVYQPEFSLFMAFISGLSISHTIHDFLPALFLKSPEAESALSSLPGIEMVEEGLGRKAFILTVIGGLSSSLVFIIILPLLFMILKAFYPVLNRFMGFILVFFLFFIILDSRSTFNALLISALSGLLGLSVLSGPRQQFILLPVFSGLFAVPAISYSLFQDFEIPRQEKNFRIASSRIREGLTGFFSGLLAGVIPGIGAAVSTTFLTPFMDSDREGFLTGLGGVNTSDMLISFLALYLIGRPRSGSSVALQMISDVTIAEVFFLIGCSLVGAGLSGVVSLRILDIFLKLVQKVNFRPLGLAVLALILSVVFYTTGFYGLAVLITSCFIGFISLLTECRASAMAVLIIPSLTYFSGSFI
jgi:putative membrane protein